jgi:hypothetical protein
MTLDALKKVLEEDLAREARQTAAHRLVEENFERLKAAWLEGGSKRMAEVYEEIAKNPVRLNPQAGE